MLSELGRRGGQKNRRYRPERSEIPQCPIKNVADVAALVISRPRVSHQQFESELLDAVGIFMHLFPSEG